MSGLLGAVQSLWRQDGSRGRTASNNLDSSASSSSSAFPWSPSASASASGSLPLSSPGLASSSSMTMAGAAAAAAPPGSPLMSPARHPASSHSAYAQAYPPLKHTLARLRSALHAVVPETLDTFNYPITIPAFNALQTSLRCVLPQDIKDYLLDMDGQDVYSASGPNLGALWGQLWLMSSEEIIAEWQLLRRMEERQAKGLKVVDDPFAEYAMPMQRTPESCPPGWVRRTYSHPAWIPLARDDSGNYIGIDLDPPQPTRASDQLNSSQNTANSSTASLNSSTASTSPYSIGATQQHQQHGPTAGSGQVIAFGRDIAGKVVLYPGWSANGSGGWARFLATVVDDLEAGEFATLGVFNNSPRRSRDQAYNSVSDRSLEDASGAPPPSSMDSPSLATAEDRSFSDDEEDQSDGIGELGYYEQHEIDEGADSDEQEQLHSSRGAAGFKRNGGSRGARRWKLEQRFRGLGFVEALCERSKERWRQIGLAPPLPVYASSRAGSARWSTSQPRSSQDRGSMSDERAGLGVRMSQAEAPDSIIQRSASQEAESSSTASAREASAGAASPNLIFSPASPSHRDDQALPRVDEEDNSSTPRLASPRQPLGSSARRQPRKPPPPPAAIAVPTMFDLSIDDTESPASATALHSGSHTSVNMG